MTASFPSPGLDRAKLVAALKEHGLSALLLTSPENLFYTTGYTALPSAGNPILYMLRNRLPAFALVTRDGNVTLLCWAFSARDVEFSADEVVGFNSPSEAVVALQSVVNRLAVGLDELGVESTCPYFVLDAIGVGIGPPRPRIADDMLNELRQIKTPAEIELLRKSLGIVEVTCGELYNVLRVGMGRGELTREAKVRLIRNGADGVSHVTLSFGSANPEFEINEPLKPDRLVTLDLGAIYRGYCSDNRRYAYSGIVPRHLHERYEAMVAIVDGVANALTPGATGPALMGCARKLYAEHGVRPLDRFNHVGHNIGLETEEYWLDENPGFVVRAGMVINLELYSIAESGDQIGDEETYLITNAGAQRLSQLPRKIREID